MSPRARPARGARPEPDAPAPRSRRRLVVAGLLTAALVAGAAGVALGGDDDPAVPRAQASAGPSADPSAAAKTAGDRWREQVSTEFRALAGASFSAVRTIVEWREGRASADDVRARIDAGQPSVQETRAALAAREPFPEAPEALVLFRAAADLYHESLQVVRTATTLPAGPAQEQLRRAGARTRDLGDRLFDQADVVLAPHLTDRPEVDGFELRKPAEVPDYAAIDLGVGPPLEPARPSPGPVRTYEPTRPVQAAQDWLAAVRAVDVPSAQELRAALTGGQAATLAPLARRLVAASDAVRALPDPRDGRATSVQLQLGLLVQAEAARAAQAAALLTGAPATELRRAAAGLAAIGDALWLRELGARSTAP